MIRNFLTTAIRNISRQKSYFIINTTGLAIGIASCIIILLFVLNEISYDRFNEKHKQIYRLYLDGKIGETEVKGAWTAAPTAKTLKNEIPEVIQSLRMDNWEEVIVKVGDKSFVESHFMIADSGFFDMFSIPLLQGDPTKVLSSPHCVVLTKDAVKKYFGDEDPIGKKMHVNTDSVIYTVTGIMDNVPENAHFEFNILGSFTSHWRSNSKDWLSNSFSTYLLLKENASVKEVEKKIKSILEAKIGPDIQSALGISLQEWNDAGNRYGLFLQPLDDIHLDPAIQHSVKPSNDKKYVYIFSVVALLIILVAVINYMNLSTAKSSKRAKEVGLRKVIGSSRNLLIGQFLSESFILSLIALLLGIVLVQLFLPFINQMTQFNLKFNPFSTWYYIPLLILLSIFVGLLAGSYTSFYLSSFKPATIFSGIGKGTRKSSLRNILVVFQFCVTIIIIFGTLVIYRQVNYMLNKDLGFEKEQLLIIKRADALGNFSKIKTFQQEIGKYTGVISSTNSTMVPCHPNENRAFLIDRKSTSDYTILMNLNWVDFNFLKTYGIKLKEGRFFSEDYEFDTLSVVINESAMKKYGFTDPLSERFLLPDSGTTKIKYEIIGVIKDYHFQSLQKDIQPQALFLKQKWSKWGGYISVRISTKNMKETIKNIEAVWDKFAPADPLQYFFMDKEFETMYSEEIRTGSISLGFAFLTIFIACLGLFGLTSYASEQRTKEIGIRKVLGSTIREIIFLLSQQVFYLLLISTLIAWPLSYLIMRNWLQNFYFHINFSIWEFLLSFIIAFIIAMLTVTYKAYMAAISDPVQALKYE